MEKEPTNSSGSTDVCGYTEHVTLSRFVYISSFGVTAIAGLFSNIILFFIFATKRRSSSSPPNLYPAVLSLLDAMLCLLFVLIFVVDVQMLYWENYELFVLYHRYILPVFGISKLVQFQIPYMLILATVERFTWVAKAHDRMIFVSRRGRLLAVVAVFLFTCIARGYSVFTNKISEFPDCPEPLRTLAVDVTSWAKDEHFNTWEPVVVAIFQTVIPFVILSVLNVLIVKKLHSYDQNQKRPVEIDEIPVLAKTPRKKGVLLKHRSLKLLHSLSLTRLTSDVRKAVFTMVAIVSTNMLCNIPHMILALLEVMGSPILYQEEDHFVASSFYTILGDTVSILYMLSSAIRILIYMKINRTIRRQVLKIFGVKKSASMMNISKSSGV